MDCEIGLRSEPGETKKLLEKACRFVSAELSIYVADPAGNVIARVSGNAKTRDNVSYVLESLPHRTEEEACAAVLKMVLMKKTSDLIDMPEASSEDELRLKLDIVCPS